MLQLAQACERASIEELAQQAHQMHVAWRPDLYEMTDELYPIEQFDSTVAARRLYVAKLGDFVVGYVQIDIRTYDYPGVSKRKVMFLEELVVHELYRNHGIGTQIVEDVKALARAFACTDLQLAVYPQNDDAIGFFQKNGLMIQSINMQMRL